MERLIKNPHLGRSALTRDMWWCECGRGLGENTNLLDIHVRWRFCPHCGALLDLEESWVGRRSTGERCRVDGRRRIDGRA